jgi:N-acetylmuramoyl-L-alanine amidase/putative methionine-R-sulfoxide reductase with GAF domain
MSATPNNAGLSGGVKGLPDLGADVWNEGVSGRDALQTLLAFACIHEQAHRRQSRGGAVSQFPKEKEEEFGLDEVLRLVAARAVSITGADGVAIALAEENAIVCRATAGRIVPDPGVRLDPNSGFSGACLRRGQTVRCDDSETDARVNAKVCRALGARSMIAVPLSAKQRVIGLIEAFSSETYGFNDSDVRSLELLAELILAAIRPQEEDRLAELASKIVVPEPAPAAIEPHEVSAETLSRSNVESVETVVDETLAPALPLSNVAASETASPAPALAEARPEVAPLPFATLDPEARKQERSFSRLALMVALTLIAIGLGVAVAWKIRHVEQSISANTRSIPQGSQRTDLNEANVPAQTPVKPSATPQVTGIRHWSSAESSTVVVDLQDQVQYEAHSLDNPRRIYFDLHDTKMAPGLFNKSVEVNDAFLKRVRMAQPVEGITRIVLETKGESEFSVSLDRNPYRLTIDVHKPGTNSGAKTSPVTLSKPSPAIGFEPKKLPASNEAGLNPTELRIVLDAGHGGWDLGTVGRKGLLEKDLVLDIVARLGKMIESKLGAQVIYTRQDDTYLPLERRAEIANLAKADLFLSVHANYSDLATARGVETYYTNTYSSIKARTADYNPLLKEVNWTGVDIRAKVMDSHRFAADVQQALFGGLVARNPEIRDRGVKAAQYVVLTGTQMPAVLAEVSFVSSPADEDQLQNSEYRQEIAEALYRGVAKYKAAVKHTKLAKLAKSAD